MRLRLDEMVPVGVARELRGSGFDVDAVVEHAGLRGLPDTLQLARAAADGRALVSYDVADLQPLALGRTASGEGHSGLVLLRSNRFPQASPDRLVESLRALLEAPEPPSEFVLWLQVAGRPAE